MAAASVDPPAELEASQPAEARGLDRDAVRLLVSDVEKDTIEHARFRDLPAWLHRGDVLVVNTSRTINAALRATTDGGQDFELHVSTPEPAARAGHYGETERWIVELRVPGPIASLPYRNAVAGMQLRLPGSGRVILREPYRRVRKDPAYTPYGRVPKDPAYIQKDPAYWGPGPEARGLSGRPNDSGARLWLAELRLPQPWLSYLDRYGFPIRYGYVPDSWPLSMYQTVFATESGSAEMPSAGRPFSPELVTRLVARGVQFAPILLHTGVSSLEDHEPPYEEYYRVSPEAAELVNAARRRGNRVVGVGTTAVRALETVTDPNGATHAGCGWTSLVITPSHTLRSVDSMITGLHEPRASHLMMLERVVRASTPLERAYAAARQEGYMWHEFGDSHLILGARR